MKDLTPKQFASDSVLSVHYELTQEFLIICIILVCT